MPAISGLFIARKKYSSEILSRLQSFWRYQPSKCPKNCKRNSDLFSSIEAADDDSLPEEIPNPFNISRSFR